MNNILNYKLIGIGKFLHGIMESGIFKFNLLKYVITNTNKLNLNMINKKLKKCK